MGKNRKSKLWSSIREISETQSGRKAIATTGAIIAATHIGQNMGPELFNTMHQALALYAAKYPFMNTSSIAETLWNGACHFAATTVDYMGNIIEKTNIILSDKAQALINESRDFIKPNLEAARDGFRDIATYAGGLPAQAVSIARDAAKSGIEFVKNNWPVILGILVAAKDASDYFEIGKNIYQRALKFGKSFFRKDKKTTEKEVNLGLNAALGGKDAITQADQIASRENVTKEINIDMDQVIRISEHLSEYLTEEGTALSQGIGTTPLDCVPRTDSDINININVTVNNPKPVSDIRIPKTNASSINPNQFKTINIIHSAEKPEPEWSESLYSQARLDTLRRTPRETITSEFDLSNPNVQANPHEGLFAELYSTAKTEAMLENIDHIKNDGPGM